MTFKPGDKVRYKNRNPHHEWHGWEGTVQAQFGGVTTALTTKPTEAAGHGTEVRLTTDNLELVAEPAFTFADIQVGDKIRRTLTRPSGTTEVREGVVLSKDVDYALETTTRKNSYILAYDSDGDPAKPQVVLELLNRPKPPHWTESKAVGSVGVILDGKQTKSLTKLGDDKWQVIYPASGNSYIRSNVELVRDWVTPEQEALLTWVV